MGESDNAIDIQDSSGDYTYEELEVIVARRGDRELSRFLDTPIDNTKALYHCVRAGFDAAKGVAWYAYAEKRSKVELPGFVALTITLDWWRRKLEATSTRSMCMEHWPTDSTDFVTSKMHRGKSAFHVAGQFVVDIHAASHVARIEGSPELSHILDTSERLGERSLLTLVDPRWEVWREQTHQEFRTHTIASEISPSDLRSRCLCVQERIHQEYELAMEAIECDLGCQIDEFLALIQVYKSGGRDITAIAQERLQSVVDTLATFMRRSGYDDSGVRDIVGAIREYEEWPKGWRDRWIKTERELKQIKMNVETESQPAQPGQTELASVDHVCKSQRHVTEDTTDSRCSVILNGPDACPVVFDVEKPKLPKQQYRLIQAMVDAYPGRMKWTEICNSAKVHCYEAKDVLTKLRNSDEGWHDAILMSGRNRYGYGLSPQNEKPDST